MTRTPDRAWTLYAISAGLLAGLMFAAFQMVVGALFMGAEGFWMPLRMIAATILGPRVLNPSYTVTFAAVAGLTLHMLLSISFALLFVAVLQPTAAIRSVDALLLRGCLYGAGLWIMNFYVLAPILGWQWFPERSNPVLQGFGHTFFYGWALGFLLSRDAVLIVENLGPDPRHQ